MYVCLSDSLPVYDLVCPLILLCSLLVGFPSCAPDLGRNEVHFKSEAETIPHLSPAEDTFITILCEPIQLIIEAQPRRFSNDSAKIAYVASLLEGPPLSYFNAFNVAAPLHCLTSPKTVFSWSPEAEEAFGR
uniref:Uncharacterized protein n=1 Tax=Sphaeramia orbicularis TaxID=375764 RepID=A0A673AKB4_9TELE